ncbi:MAG: hypothetical protein OXU45_08000 [Candidatus Melainabacteria bacterium]|nr:hypothetical protein [Candidatus Melainabacteria bacterium]
MTDTVTAKQILDKTIELRPSGASVELSDLVGGGNTLDEHVQSLTDLSARLTRRKEKLNQLGSLLAQAPENVNTTAIGEILEPLNTTVTELSEWLSPVLQQATVFNDQVRVQNSSLESAVKQFVVDNTAAGAELEMDDVPQSFKPVVEV